MTEATGQTFLAEVPSTVFVAVPVELPVLPDEGWLLHDCPLCGEGLLSVNSTGRCYCYGCGASGWIEGAA